MIVEQTPLCRWCGVGVMWVGEKDGWRHEVNARSNGGRWCVGSILYVATPTQWEECRDGGGGMAEVFITPAEARKRLGFKDFEEV